MDLQNVEAIVALIAEYPVSEICVEKEGMKIIARKPLVIRPSDSAAVPQLPADRASAVPEEMGLEEVETAVEPTVITAALVGLFRHAEPPVGYGTRLAAGDIVGSIESMKVLNDVRADSPGQVVDILVEEGSPVEYGQSLFRLMPE